MTSFVHLEYATEHPGVARVESAIRAAQHLRQGFSATRALARLLLSAIAAAVMVVTYQLMETMADGHLLVLWTGLWAAAFIALAVFASATRHLAVRLKARLDGWSRSMAQARADERLWAIAKVDPRVMADLQNAIIRNEQALPDEAAVDALPAVMPNVVIRGKLLRAYQQNYI